jgi:peptide/nickel transport system substrate-binding protein
MCRWRALFCVLAIAFPLSAIAASADDQKTLVIGTITTPILNNALGSGLGPGTPGTQVFAGLVELDDHFVPQPYLATSWEVSPDGLSYTFHLRANARFHDGTPITSEDVAFSVDTVRANHPFGRSMFGPVERVETPDPLTARFILKQRHPALLASVTALLLPILPKHVYSVGPIRTNPANTMAIGSGPYKVVEFKAGQSITLEKNKDFFLPDRPRTDRIVFRFFDDMQASRLAIENGETDAILQTGFGYTDFARLKSNPKLNVFTNAYAGLGIVDYIEFNLRRRPFNDVRVRRALAHAVDRKFLVEKFQAGVTKPLEGPLPPDSLFASTDLVHYDYDLEAAKNLLDEAGYKPDANGIRFKVTIDAPTFSPDGLGRVADYLKPQLKKIGIEVERRVSPDTATWAQRLSNYDYDMAMSQIYNYPDPVIGTHRLFLCKNQIKGVIFTNTGGYCNEKVDEILDQASKEIDFDRRKALYAQFQKIITEDVPYVYTTTELPYGVALKAVVGLPKTVLGSMAPLLDIEKK